MSWIDPTEWESAGGSYSGCRDPGMPAMGTGVSGWIFHPCIPGSATPLFPVLSPALSLDCRPLLGPALQTPVRPSSAEPS